MQSFLKSKSDPIIPWPKTLYWLLIFLRIKCKLHTIAYKTLRDLALLLL